MKVLRLFILLVLALFVASSEVTMIEEAQTDFLADCMTKGNVCSATNPCCEGLTCSEFKICRS